VPLVGRGRALVGAGGRHRRSVDLATEVDERADELVDRGIGGEGRIGRQRHEVVLPRRLVGIEHPEDPPATVVHRGDEAPRERRPAVAHDEDVVRLVERHRRFDDDLAHPGSAVVREVPVQPLHPDFG
jgi:hypothetical protein